MEFNYSNIPSAHPIALLNNGKTDKISYSVVDMFNHKVIKVSGGSNYSTATVITTHLKICVYLFR